MERIDWVAGTPQEAVRSYLRWREAVEAADKGNAGKLAALFRTQEPLGSEARLLIADLLERYNLVRRRGRPRTPAYRLTPAEARIAHLLALYRYYRRKRVPREEAIRRSLWDDSSEEEPSQADLDGLPEGDVEMLFNAVQGRRGSANRRRKVRP